MIPMICINLHCPAPGDTLCKEYAMKEIILKQLVLALLLAGQAAFAADIWLISAHEVPLPAAASEELRKAIAATPVPDRSSHLKFPTSDAQWRQTQESDSKNATAGLDQIASVYSVAIERGRIDGVAVAWLGPGKIAPMNANRLFIHLHGGAYVYGSGDAAFREGVTIAGRLGIPVLSIDYRVPPDYPFPAAVDDVVTVYRHLLKSRSPETMVIGGTSAGGGLALASVHKFKQINLPAPAGVFAGTAWADLTKTGDTLYTNEGLDRILVTYDGMLEAAAKLYADGHDMKDPLISPVYGDFKGFPPVILVTGTRDLLLSDVVRTHRRLRAAGVIADLHVYEGMSHADYAIVATSPESLDMYRELGDFVSRHLAQ